MFSSKKVRELEARISKLEVLVDALTSAQKIAPPQPASKRGPRRMDINKLVIDAIPSGRQVRVSDVTKAVRALDRSCPRSVIASCLVRLANSGELARVERGRYVRRAA